MSTSNSPSSSMTPSISSIPDDCIQLIYTYANLKQCNLLSSTNKNLFQQAKQNGSVMNKLLEYAFNCDEKDIQELKQSDSNNDSQSPLSPYSILPSRYSSSNRILEKIILNLSTFHTFPQADRISFIESIRNNSLLLFKLYQFVENSYSYSGNRIPGHYYAKYIQLPLINSFNLHSRFLVMEAYLNNAWKSLLLQFNQVSPTNLLELSNLYERGGYLICLSEINFSLTEQSLHEQIVTLTNTIQSKLHTNPRDNSLEDCINDLCTVFRSFNFNADFHSEQNYYQPENSFLNEVILQRKGIPISLSLLFMIIGLRLGLNVFGLNLPAHFMVAMQIHNSSNSSSNSSNNSSNTTESDYICIDCFHHFEHLNSDEVRLRLENLGVPRSSLPQNLFGLRASAADLFHRMYRNIINIYNTRMILSSRNDTLNIYKDLSCLMNCNSQAVQHFIPPSERFLAQIKQFREKNSF